MNWLEVISIYWSIGPNNGTALIEEISVDSGNQGKLWGWKEAWFELNLKEWLGPVCMGKTYKSSETRLAFEDQ